MSMLKKVRGVKQIFCTVFIDVDVGVDREVFGRESPAAVDISAVGSFRNRYPQLHKNLITRAVIKVELSVVVCNLWRPVKRRGRLKRFHSSPALVPVYEIRGYEHTEHISVTREAGAEGEILAAEF